jgi:hypothetical protein
MSLRNGMCYDGFPAPYDPSTANRTSIFFGSDAAYDAMAPLWGGNYTSSTGSACGNGGASCRNDIRTMHDMGVQVIRLYDWEPRNKHLKFLDECHGWGLGVLVPVSNYFLQQAGGFPGRETLIPQLLRSFANAEGTDYHAAVAGVVIGNELAGYGADECVTFSQGWVAHEARLFSHARKVRLGHPVQFDPFGAALPGFGFWDKLLPRLQQGGDIKSRLFLAPQTYNNATYLFETVGGGNGGWVDMAWQKYRTPIWFTEIGQSRVMADAADVVKNQLLGVRQYAIRHPDRLIGACFFQFADKVWLKPGESEAEFGAFSHTDRIQCTIRYSAKDFTHWEASSDDTLKVDVLAPSSLFAAVRSVYTAGG